MKALFIGGTGTISTDVVELAQQRGWEITPVSYTHLDVYKRQTYCNIF